MKKVYILSALLSLATCFTAKADNGKALEVYTVFGKLAGKAVAKGGKATVNAASLTNGVYVIKAEGQALKMIKKNKGSIS